MRILVTGGAGYIGSHTVVALLDAGYDVVIADNFCNSKPESLERIRKITGRDFVFCETDLCDPEATERIFAENDIDAVIHFAGLKAVGESVTIPIEYYRNNILNTLTLCSVMSKHSCKRIVFSSSATVYGLLNPSPYVETMPTGATSPYGRTKLMIEEILRDIWVSDNEWSVALLRYFNPICAHPSGLIGEDPQGIPNNLFPYIAQVAVGRRDKLHIYGDDYATPDGTGVRDYVHVCDLAEGHLRALEFISGRTGVEAINLGTGKGSSVFDVLHSFERACGKTLPYTIDPRRPGDIDNSYANAQKAKELLDWEAKFSIDDMCDDGWRFISRNPMGYADPVL